MPGVAGFLTGHSVFNGPFSLLLVQLLGTMALSRAIGKVFQFVQEPMVISEIVAGIILGPTVLGNWEWFADTFFPASSLPLMTAVANFGLVLFMFLVGCEIDMKLLRPRLKISLATGAMGTAVCFAVTAPLAVMIRKFDCEDGHSTEKGCAADLLSGSVSFVAFYLFLGVIVSISALPVLARILTDFRILTSKIGVLVMATTTIEDFIAWPLLAISLAIAGATKKITILYLFLLLLGDLLLVGLVVRPLLILIVRYYARRDGLTHMGLFLVMSVLIALSFYAEIIGLSAFIGAFQVGLVMPRRGNIIGQISSKIEDLTVVLLLPLFFASSGQKTNLKEINTGLLWAITITIIATSTVGKVLGCVPPAKWIAGLSLRESVTFGVLMNTKGLVALVSLNLGLSYGIITVKLFSMLVLMVIINTLLTCPLVWLLNRVFFRERKAKERQAADERAADRRQAKRSVLLYLQPTLLSETLTIVRLILGRDTQWILLRLLETADRPSTYMGPLQKKMVKRDQVLRSALEFAQIVEVPPPEVLCDVSSDFIHGVRVAAIERDPNILFLSFDRSTDVGENTYRDLEPLATTHSYTIIALVDQRVHMMGEQNSEDSRDHGLSNQQQPHRPAAALRAEGISFVFPYSSGPDSDEALTLAIQLSNRGVAVEVIQTDAANEMLRRLFTGQSVSYRVQAMHWREALAADTERPGRIALLPYNRDTVAYAMTAAIPVLLVKGPSAGVDVPLDDISDAPSRPPSRSSNLGDPI